MVLIVWQSVYIRFIFGYKWYSRFKTFISVNMVTKLTLPIKINVTKIVTLTNVDKRYYWNRLQWAFIIDNKTLFTSNSSKLFYYFTFIYCLFIVYLLFIYCYLLLLSMGTAVSAYSVYNRSSTVIYDNNRLYTLIIVYLRW